MKTTIDIPTKELQELLHHTNAKTKKQAILQAVTDYNRRRRMANLTRMLGTFSDFMTLEDLHEMRSDKEWKRKK